jgi:hypothetical protein
VLRNVSSYDDGAIEEGDLSAIGLVLSSFITPLPTDVRWCYRIRPCRACARDKRPATNRGQTKSRRFACGLAGEETIKVAISAT